jgi:hypothetical protein
MRIIFISLFVLMFVGCSRHLSDVVRLRDIMDGSVMVYYANAHYSDGGLRITAVTPPLFPVGREDGVYKMGDLIDKIPYDGSVSEFPEAFVIFIEKIEDPVVIRAYIPVVNGHVPTVVDDEGRPLSFNELKTKLNKWMPAKKVMP